MDIQHRDYSSKVNERHLTSNAKIESQKKYQKINKQIALLESIDFVNPGLLSNKKAIKCLGKIDYDKKEIWEIQGKLEKGMKNDEVSHVKAKIKLVLDHLKSKKEILEKNIEMEEVDEGEGSIIKKERALAELDEFLKLLNPVQSSGPQAENKFSNLTHEEVVIVKSILDACTDEDKATMFSSLSTCLLSGKLDSDNRIKILNAVVDTAKENRKDIVDAGSSMYLLALGTGNTGAINNVANFIKNNATMLLNNFNLGEDGVVALNKILLEQDGPVDYMTDLMYLLPKLPSIVEKESFVELISDSPASDRKGFVDDFSKFIQFNADSFKAFVSHSNRDRKNIALLSEVFVSDSNPISKLKAACYVSDLPLAERADIVNTSKTLFEKSMRFEDKQEIVALIREMPQSSRNENIESAKNLFRSEIEPKSILRLASSLPAGVGREVSDLVKSILDGMPVADNLQEINALILAISNIPDKERKDVVENAKQLFEATMKSADRLKTLNMVKNIDASQREFIVKAAQALKSQPSSFEELQSLFNLIGSINPTDGNTFVALAVQIAAVAQLSDKGKAFILKLILGIPPEEREGVVRLAIPFLNGKMNTSDVAFVFERIQAMPQDNRRESILLASTLFTEDMGVHAKWELLKAVVESPREHRAEIVRLTFICTEGMDFAHKLQTLDCLKSIVENGALSPLHQLFSEIGLLTTDVAVTIKQLLEKFGPISVTACIKDRENKHAAFQLLSELSQKSEKEVMEALLAKFGGQYIASHFSKVASHLPPHLLIDLTTYLIQNEPNAVLQNREEFPLQSLPKAGLHMPTPLDEIARMRTNLAKIATQVKAEITFGDHSGITLDQLLTLFDKINFTDPGRSGYVPPSACTDDGINKPPIHFKNGLETLINTRIANRQPYTAVPSMEDARNAYYERLEQSLKEVMRLSNENGSSESSLIATELVKLGAAGHHCGSRWFTDSIAAIKTIANLWEADMQTQGISGIVGSFISSNKEGVLEELTMEFTSRYGGEAYQPHIYNAMAKCMREYGIEPPNANLIDFDDRLMPHFSDNDAAEIRRRFESCFSVSNLTRFIAAGINEDIELNRASLIDVVVSSMRGMVEPLIQAEVRVLEDNLVSEKVKYGKAAAKELLEEAEINLAIINGDRNRLETLSSQSPKDKMAILRLINQFNSKLSNQVEKRMQREGLQESDQLQVEGELRAKAKASTERRLQEYTQLLTPTADMAKLQALGAERAQSELMANKDTLADAYLAKENLLIYEKVNIYDESLRQTVEFERPRITARGCMALLKSMEYFKVQAPAPFETESISLHAAGPGRRSLEATIQQLKAEFEEGLYIRTFADAEFEYSDVITGKMRSEQNPAISDSKYWSSASTVQAGLRNQLWKGLRNDRCGLCISSEAPLGGWHRRDMGTENVPATVTDADAIENYFPNHFPRVDLPAILGIMGKKDGVAKELAEKILALPPGTASADDLARAEKFVEERAKPGHAEHEILLSRLPSKYKSSFTFEEAKQAMREMGAQRSTQEYSEAKIHYRPNDILGVLVFNDPNSIAKGAELQRQLASSGMLVPLVTFEENNGKIRVYNQAGEVPPHLP